MSEFKVEVLMAVHMGSDYRLLRRALQSIAEQTFSQFGMVIVEDGPVSSSIDKTIQHFEQRLTIKRLKLPRNQGLGAALSAGLTACSAELVARMDCDDWSAPDRIERQVSRFESQPDLDVLGSFALEVDESGVENRLRTVPLSHEAIIQAMWANPIIHPSVMFRRASILNVGSYSPQLRRRQDYELWFRCANAGLRFANEPAALIMYTFSPKTHSKQSRRQTWEQAWIGFKGSRLIGLPTWKQVACFYPFFRSLLPLSFQHAAYNFMIRFDPRKN